MDRFFVFLSRMERWLLIVLMIVLIFVCAAQVFFRIVMHAPLAWTEEMARYAFVWLTFIGAASVVGHWGHFQVDILISRLSPPMFLLFRWFSYVCIVGFAYIMVFHGWELLGKVYVQKSAAMLIPMSLPYLALPLSGTLMIIHVIGHILNDVRTAKKRKEAVL